MLAIAIAIVAAGWWISSAIQDLSDEVHDFNGAVQRIEDLLLEEDDWS